MAFSFAFSEKSFAAQEAFFFPPSVSLFQKSVSRSRGSWARKFGPQLTGHWFSPSCSSEHLRLRAHAHTYTHTDIWTSGSGGCSTGWSDTQAGCGVDSRPSFCWVFYTPATSPSWSPHECHRPDSQPICDEAPATHDRGPSRQETTSRHPCGAL